MRYTAPYEKENGDCNHSDSAHDSCQPPSLVDIPRRNSHVKNSNPVIHDGGIASANTKLHIILSGYVRSYGIHNRLLTATACRRRTTRTRSRTRNSAGLDNLDFRRHMVHDQT